MAKVTSFFESIVEKIHEAPSYMQDVVFFAPVGLLVGFLCKNFGRFVLITVLIVAAVICVSSYFNIIMIDIARMKAMFGLQEVASWADFQDYVLQWVYEHSIGCVVFVIACVIGWKLGA